MNVINLFKPPRLSARASAGLLILRLVVGLAFVFHGYDKIKNPFGWMPGDSIPGVFQALAAISEFGGGMAWMLGLLTPLASFGLLCTMAIAVRLVAFVMQSPFVAKKPDDISYELASVYLCVALLLLFAGPGRFSVDRLIFGEKSNEGKS